MKSKLYSGIILLLLITGSNVKAQNYDIHHYKNDEAKVIVNNYYGDYDYFFSSRINRFHRSYAVFDYYAPVFTDTYWYNYRPFSWGISIYDGGFGIEYSNNFPVYNYDYRFSNGWYDPNYWGSYYWDYNPFNYNSWYLPVVINLNSGFGWHNNYNSYWRRNHGYYDFRYSYNSHNDNYHNSNSNHSYRYSSVSDFSEDRSLSNSGSSAGNGIRRERPSVSSSWNESFDRNPERSGSGLQRNETIRNSNPATNRKLGMNNTRNSGKIINNGNYRSRRIDTNNGDIVNNTRNEDFEVNKSKNQNMSNDRNNGKTINAPERRSSIPSNVQVIRADEQQSPGRRSFYAGSGSGSNQNRTMSSPVRSFSSSVSRGSGSQRSAISSRSESKSGALTRSSSSSKEKSGKRR